MRSAASIAISFLIASAVAAGPARADIIQLKDGRSISGSLRRQGDRITITADDGTQTVVPPGDIARVTLTSTVTRTQAAESEWTRDAAAIKQANDLETILEIHQRFLQKYPDQPISKEVAASLREYTTLARQDGIKFRGRWMPRAQVEVTRQQWADRAKPALELYKANNLRGTLDAARNALRDDPINPDALTLAGLAAYRLNSLNLARGYFSTLAGNDPTNVLAENNLAVILSQQHRQPESLSYYARALQASPENRFVADNIEEALHAYTGSTNITPYQDLTRLFAQAEPRIETEMAQRGLYRYGSTWVPLHVLDRLKANIQNIKNAMAQLDAQYQGATSSSATIDAAIAKANADYDATAANIGYLNYVIATTYGEVSSLISQRDALVADLQRIEANRAALQAQKQAALTSAAGAPEQADRLKAALAAAEAGQFSGTQRILDWGEADNPPPPAIVSLPSPVPIALPVPAPVPVSPQDNEPQSLLTSGYQQASTPIGLIGIPLPFDFGGGNFRRHPHHRGDDDRDDHHRHDRSGDRNTPNPAENAPAPIGSPAPVGSPVPPIGTPIPTPIGSPVPPIGSPITTPIGTPVERPLGPGSTPRSRDNGPRKQDSTPTPTPAPAPVVTPVAPPTIQGGISLPTPASPPFAGSGTRSSQSSKDQSNNRPGN